MHKIKDETAKKINLLKTKNPEKLAALLKETRPESKVFKTVLGLDLGTSCGYCFGRVSADGELVKIDPWTLGIWDLSAGPYDSGALRFVRLRQFLALSKPDFVAYEDVKFTPARSAGVDYSKILARAATSLELLGAYRATVVTWCEENNIPCTGFGIGEIKKRATGSGKAYKPQIIEACNKELGLSLDTDNFMATGYDDMADAFFVCMLACEHYAEGLIQKAEEKNV